MRLHPIIIMSQEFLELNIFRIEFDGGSVCCRIYSFYYYYYIFLFKKLTLRFVSVYSNDSKSSVYKYKLKLCH